MAALLRSDRVRLVARLGVAQIASGKVAWTGLGRLHHPIATRSAEAQRFFDQALTLVYGFNHDEAVRSFRRAAELDPASPMPHWGIALALGPNINLDVDPEREKAAYDTNDPKSDLKALAVQYKNAMRDLVRQYPNDLDAATLYAESLMDLHPWQLRMSGITDAGSSGSSRRGGSDPD